MRVLSILLCALVATSAVAAPEPLADFARHPQYEQVKISPDGDYLAATAVVRGSTVLALLRQNELDIAFVIGEPAFEDCHSRPFWHEKLLFALPQDHPLTVSQAIPWEAARDETFIISRKADVKRVNSGPEGGVFIHSLHIRF